MWIVCTGAAASRKIALYTYRDSRRKTVAEELLGGYTGVVQTDGLQSYGSDDYENAGCWAHARRKFFDCIPDGDTACPSAQIVALIDKAAEYERTAREKNYTAQQILEMQTEKVRPLLNQVYEIINTLHPGKDSALGRAVTYAMNQKEKLYLFLKHAEVEMTNNLAERTVVYAARTATSARSNCPPSPVTARQIMIYLVWHVNDVTTYQGGLSHGRL